MVILDTDAISFLEYRDSAESKKLQSRLTVLSSKHEITTTIITYEEQTRGWFKKMARAKNIQEQIVAYARLNKHLYGYRDITVLDFEEGAAAHFQALKSSKLRVGTADLKIASVALSHDALLLSRNLHDFGKIPNLHVQDWTNM